MSSLKIAHVLSSFHTGGQERIALDLAIQQHAAGHQVCAISLAPLPEGPNGAAFRAAGIRTQTVAKRKGGVDVTLPFRLAAFLVQRGADVVHTHNPHALVYGAPAAGLLHAASVHTKHGTNPDGPRRMWLRRAAASLVDAYVAVTPTLASLAIQNRECAADRVRVIPNGIDAARFAPNLEARRRTRAELGIPQDAWVVGTVGRLSPEKDQASLVDAMTPLLDQGRQLVIVGDGPEREPLSLRIAATWRAHFVHLTGARSNVEDWLSAFDVFALTSRSEGLPLALLEAMAAGLPVISTAVGGVPDLVEPGVTGSLVEAGDRVGLEERLTWLANRPALAGDMAELAQYRVLARYTTDRMARDYEALYERLVAERARARTAKPALLSPGGR
jgi:glycosyltransferase involved in cell wall biosynthesis